MLKGSFWYQNLIFAKNVDRTFWLLALEFWGTDFFFSGHEENSLIDGNKKFMPDLYKMFENKLTTCNISLGENFENVSLDPTIFQTELDEK